MGKTITIEDDAYKILCALKEGPGDSFTKVIRRNLHEPLETAGELLDHYESVPPPKADLKVLDQILKNRGRRSGGRR